MMSGSMMHLSFCAQRHNSLSFVQIDSVIFLFQLTQST